MPDGSRQSNVARVRAAFGPRGSGEWAQTLALAGLIAAVVALASTRIGFARYDYLVGAGAVLGAAFLALLVLGPSRVMISVFLVFMITGHQFRSFLILPFGGVEWHPRELLFFVLMAHLAVKLVQMKADVRRDIMHYFFFLYIVFFAFIAARGFLKQPDLQAVVAECRYPIFLLSYFVFVACIGTYRDLRYYVRLVFVLSILIAVAAIAFFAYTCLSGNVINDQNVLGEYVRRQIGPYLLQSVRPNGHLFFEIGAVILVGLFFCREETWLRRLFYLAVLAVYLAAIAITMMRTAYVSLFVSLAVLCVLCLPKEFQALAWFFGLVFAAVAFVGFGMHIHDYVLQWAPEAEVSLKGRFVEIEGALQVFAREPLLGAGMGSSFAGMGYVAKTTQASIAQTDYQTVHNVWMYYLFKGGLVGMVFVGLGLGGIILRAYRIIDHLPSQHDRFFMRGTLAAFLGQLIASLTMPRLTYPIGGVVLAMIASAFVVIARERAPAPAPGSNTPPIP